MKTAFEEWYEKVITPERLKEYSLETLLKWAFIEGARHPDSQEKIFIKDKDEDLILSPELDDPNFTYEAPANEKKSIENKFSKEELDEIKNHFNQKRIENGIPPKVYKQ